MKSLKEKLTALRDTLSEEVSSLEYEKKELAESGQYQLAANKDLESEAKWDIVSRITKLLA